MLKKYSISIVCIFFLYNFQVGAQTPATRCPDGTVQGADNLCFKFMNDFKNFNDAESSCASLGGHLAVITNGFDNNNVAQQAQTFHSSDIWIGAQLYTKDSCQSWVWTDKKKLVVFNDFPNADTCANTGGQCVAVSAANGKWSATDCSLTKPYACTFPRVISYCPDDWIYYDGTNSCYKVFYSAAWQDAENNCIAQGAHLTSIHNDAENEFICSIARSGYSDTVYSYVAATWIGLHTTTSDNSVYLWTDGTPFDYPHWGQGEPNEPGTQQCVNLITDTLADQNAIYNHLFTNFYCSSVAKNYVCKKSAITAVPV